MIESKKLFAVIFSILFIFIGIATVVPSSARADGFADSAASPELTGTVDAGSGPLGQWSVFGQFTFVSQYHPSYHAAYRGQNSLDSKSGNRETADVTLSFGHRLWRGAEFWAYPEIDQGFGFNNTLGIAGFSSGEAYKVGKNQPYLRLPRLFVRQVIDLAGGQQHVDAAAGQMGGNLSANNVTFTVGKFSVVDLFDNNSYAHDPRTDFLNWSVIDAGPFDYAADAWGFTNGAAAEWNQNAWTLRGGFFQLSKVPNGKVTGFHFRGHSFIGELEHRHQWLDHPGKVKLMAFNNRGDMASYKDAVQLGLLTGTTPDVSLVRRYSSNTGYAINFEQELIGGLGAFARAAMNGGKKEAYEFTEINRSVSAGLSLKGNRWQRPNDKLGVAGVVNSLSGDARAYFAAGGLGILIGDGQLNYAKEKIAEAYYSIQVMTGASVTFDFQRVVNPAYNRDRGPVPIYAVRFHAEF